MGKRVFTLALLICFLLALASPLSAGAAVTGGTSASGTLSKITSLLDESATIRDALNALADWQLDDSDDDTQEFEDSMREINEKRGEVNGYISTLDGLVSEANTMTLSGTEGEKKTAAAAAEYLGRIKRAAEDILDVFDYYIALVDALEPFINFAPPESTSGYYDYSLFAGQLSQVVSQCQRGLGAMKVPAYLASPQGDMIKRYDEYQSFCQDFSIAIQFDDPLRIYSCINRMSRLDLQVGKALDNIQQDVDLQFTHMRDRLSGDTEKIRTEIETNIALLSQRGS